jgi:hypothetical protein
MSGIVMILQICSKYAREICQVLSWFYKYLVSMLEIYIRYCHELQIFGKYARGIYQVLSWFYKYLECMLEGYVGYCHDFTNI